MFFKRYLFVLIMIFPAISFAQQPEITDSLNTTHKDKTIEEQNHSIVTYIPPAAFVTWGILSFHVKGIRQIDYNVYNDMQKDHPGFKTHADNYLQFAPAAIVYGLNLAGVHGKHNFADRTALYVLSEGIFAGSTFTVKNLSKRTRPSDADKYSFPSGHTGNAFAAAEFLNQEYGDISPWYGIAGYSIAATTGILRVYNNAHWFSDVVAGAGVGILSTKIAYLVYPYIKKQFSGGKGDKNTGTMIMPTYQNQMFGFSFVKTL
jgi:membrane-associated phospholipid phosphatase